jgi:mevalonate pyrophosphate decarboxylase
MVDGFAYWPRASTDAHQLAPADAWDELAAVAVLLDRRPKMIPSKRAHACARTSPLWKRRVWVANHELAPRACSAIATKDLMMLGGILEQDTRAVHHCLATATPKVSYGTDATRDFLDALARWRASSGVPVFASQGYGPNIVLVLARQSVAEVAAWLDRSFAKAEHFVLGISSPTA